MYDKAVLHKENEEFILNRPYITKFDFSLEILSYIATAIALIIAVIGVVTTDGTVPTRFENDGSISTYGSPMSFLLLPLLFLAVNVLFSVSIHVVSPSRWRLPVKHFNAENADAVYKDIAHMITCAQILLSAFSVVFTHYFIKADGLMTVNVSYVLIAALLVVFFGWSLAARHHNAKGHTILG